MNSFPTTAFRQSLKSFFLVALFFVVVATRLYAQPIISTVLPNTGKIGDTVTITGNGFGAGTNNNIVFLGSVRAPVLSATATQLVIRVPYGATYSPVSVSTGNLSCYSRQLFNVIYAEPGGILPGCLEMPKTFTGGNGGTSTAAADIDGDGKTDAVIVNGNANYVSVIRNTSTTTISFDTTYKLPITNNPFGITIGDINSDGKPDVVTVNLNPFSITLFKNKSTTGVIAFDAGVQYAISNYPISLKVADIDLDGKPDMLVSNVDSITIFRNNSNSTAISFESARSFKVGSNPTAIDINDMDGNGVPDIIVVNSGTIYAPDYISVLPNASTPGNLMFGTRTDIPTSFYPAELAIGDIDNDGKNDISVLTFMPDSKICIFRNKSIPGTLLFDTAVIKPAGSYTASFHLSDIDGDGKVDFTFLSSSSIYLLQNKSVPGSISTGVAVNAGLYPGANAVATGDYDNDGKTDILSSVNNTTSMVVFRNKSNEPIITSFFPIVGTSGTPVTIRGLNFHDATVVKFGSVPVSSFTIVSDSVILAIPGAGETGYITVISPKGSFESLDEFGFNIPSITSFFPDKGRLGSAVMITGNHFSPVPANNLVYFGAVKAVVQSATSSSLTVTVPAGASFQPITVTVNKRTASSSKPFTVTFPGGNLIDTNSFAAKLNISLPGQPRMAAVADFDNDGKPDLAISNYSSYSLSILRNTSTGNTISFAPRMNIGSIYTSQKFIATGDLNGDGKQDIVVGNYSYINISIFINTSTGSNISFDVIESYADEFHVPGIVQGVCIADYDGDGKADIGVANGFITSGTPSVISFFRNNSRGSTLVFAARQDIPSVTGPFDFACGDMNGDNKPDIVITNNNSNTVSVYNNTGSPGTISFGARIDYPTATTPYGAEVADMDGDNKPDIAVANGTSGTISFLRNISTGVNISLAPKTDFNSLQGAYDMSVNDINGDGKPDIVNNSTTGNGIAVLNNNSTAGTIAMAAPQTYATGAPSYGVCATDLNGDGAPELISVNTTVAGISVFRNKLLDSVILAICPPVASTTIVSNITGSSYQWQVDTGTGFINITDNINYTGSQTLTLQLNNIPSSWHGYRYRCNAGGDFSRLSILKVRNTWTGAAGNAWENPANWSCHVVPDLNTDVIITSGSVVLNSNTSCGSITVTAPASFTIAAGYILTITR